MILRPIPNSELVEVVEVERIAINGDIYTMHRGYRCNGASIPAIFQPITISAYHPRVIGGAAWHDFFYDTHLVKKWIADKLLYLINLDDGVEPQVALNIYTAVKDFGGPAWKRAHKQFKASVTSDTIRLIKGGQFLERTYTGAAITNSYRIERKDHHETGI